MEDRTNKKNKTSWVQPNQPCGSIAVRWEVQTSFSKKGSSSSLLELLALWGLYHRDHDVSCSTSNQDVLCIIYQTFPKAQLNTPSLVCFHTRPQREGNVVESDAKWVDDAEPVSRSPYCVLTDTGETKRMFGGHCSMVFNKVEKLLFYKVL